jgi:hypothetical protein
VSRRRKRDLQAKLERSGGATGSGRRADAGDEECEQNPDAAADGSRLVRYADAFRRDPMGDLLKRLVD